MASSCLVFGELAFDGGGWQDALAASLHAILEFDQHADEELLRLDVAPERLRVRAWLHGPSLRSWCPALEALIGAAALLGATGEVVFVGQRRAYRFAVDDKRVRLGRAPYPDNDHPAVLDIALLVEARAVGELPLPQPAASSQRVQTSGQ